MSQNWGLQEWEKKVAIHIWAPNLVGHSQCTLVIHKKLVYYFSLLAFEATRKTKPKTFYIKKKILLYLLQFQKPLHQ